MAIPVYLWLEDDGGSPIKGSVDVNGREGSIEVSELMHSVEQPTDPLTDKETAKRSHSSYSNFTESTITARKRNILGLRLRT